eukprot:6175257-Pleurochrysis_carterae.AAC.1
MRRRGAHAGRLQPVRARGVHASCAGRAVMICAPGQLGVPEGIRRRRRGRLAGEIRCDRRGDLLARVRVGVEEKRP